MSASRSHFDAIIIGAGLQGLCAAHTFLKIDPELSLLIIDDKATVGGTWAKQQLYDGFRACNLQGFFEYSDFPILEAGLGVEPRGLLEGETIYKYLYRYAEHFGLLSRTRLNTKVIRATNNENEIEKAWSLELISGDGKAATETVTCSKLLVATGQTSQPRIPSFAGSFGGPILHTSAIASEKSKSLLSDQTVNNITILGSSKSAHDAVYNLASTPNPTTSRPRTITWLIRPSPQSRRSWMATSYPLVGPFKLWLEGLLMTRPLSWMSAAPWSDGDGFSWARSFLHGTSVGRAIVRGYFGQMSADTIAQNGLLKLGENEGRKALTPHATLMWYGGQAGILNYETDFYDTIKDADVQIVQDTVDHLEEGSMVLGSGRRVKTDAIICGTGYQYGPSFPLLPAAKQPGWGVPVLPSQDTVFAPLEKKADTELLARFPALATSPAAPEKDAGLSAWRLWRFIAPPSQVCAGESNQAGTGSSAQKPDRNLVFLTCSETYQNALKAEIVALWAYAYLNGKLAVQPGTVEEVRYEATLWSRFGWWSRPLGKQGKTADLMHDAMPYYDRLMRDLGLRSWRKGWGLLGELFGGYYQVKDYNGLVDEWKETQGM